MKRAFQLILVLFSLNSCNYIFDLKRTGDQVSEEIPWNGATQIEIWAPVHLILVNSDEVKMEISGMDFIVDGYNLIQSDEKLIIKHQNSNQLQEAKIADLTLYAPQFKQITANSPSKITNKDTLRFDNLNIVVNGKGVFTTSELTLKGNNFSLAVYGGSNKSKHILSGKLHSVLYNIQGGTDIEAFDLLTSQTTIIQKSYGDCYVSATDYIEVNTYSTGDVYYEGSPEIKFQRIVNTLMKASGQIYKY